MVNNYCVVSECYDVDVFCYNVMYW